MGRFETTARTYAARREPYPPEFFAAAACGGCGGILFRSLRVISVIDEEARQYVRVDRLD